MMMQTRVRRMPGARDSLIQILLSSNTCTFVASCDRPVAVALTIPGSVYNVYTTCKSGKTKYNSLKDIARPLISFTSLFLVSTLWAHYSKSDVLSQDPRIYYLAVGTIFSNISVSFFFSSNMYMFV